jgi:hypothetical protein
VSLKGAAVAAERRVHTVAGALGRAVEGSSGRLAPRRGAGSKEKRNAAEGMSARLQSSAGVAVARSALLGGQQIEAFPSLGCRKPARSTQHRERGRLSVKAC